jgi:hypothetical protein
VSAARPGWRPSDVERRLASADFAEGNDLNAGVASVARLLRCQKCGSVDLVGQEQNPGDTRPNRIVRRRYACGYCGHASPWVDVEDVLAALAIDR